MFDLPHRVSTFQRKWISRVLAADLLQPTMLMTCCRAESCKGCLAALNNEPRLHIVKKGARCPVGVPVALKTRTERVETCVEAHPVILTCSVSRSLTSMMVYAGSLAATGIDPESLSDM